MDRQGAWTLHATIHAEADANGAFTNMPSAATFLFSSHRHVTLVDLEGMSKIRLKVNKQSTAGAGGSKLILRYSTTFSTTASSYVDIGTSEVSVNIDITNTYLDSGWIDIADSAKTDVYIAVIGTGGDGTIDPAFGNISFSCI